MASHGDKLLRELVGLAGEHLAAGELLRRGVYAQITYGNRKKVDLLIDGSKALARVEIKSKQGQQWPGVKGISPQEKNRFLVLVDFQNKRKEERPDFYVMNHKDWGQFVRRQLRDRLAKGEVTLDPDNVPYWPSGKGYFGTGITTQQIQGYKECWEKILEAVGSPS
jgi:hypothetical protein